MVTATLDAMAAGGMYDVVGGGFHRYSVDDRWLVPHFEKMLYDNAVLASTYLHAWVVTGQDALPRGGRGDARLRPAGAGAPGGRARVGAGCGHRRRRRADLHVDAGRGCRGRLGAGAAGAVRARTVRRSGRARSGAARTRARRARDASPAVPRRQGARIVERARARRARGSRPTGSSATTGSTPRVAWRSSCSGRCRREDGRLLRSRRDGRASGAPTSTTTRTSRTASWSCTSRRASFAGCSRPAGLRCWRSSSSRTPSTAASSSLPRTGTSACPRTKELQDTPIPSGNSMLALVLLRLARIWGDDELERHAVSVFRLVEPACHVARRGRSPGRSAASISGSARRGRSRSSARWTRRSRARRSHRSSRTPSSRSARPKTYRCLRARDLVDGKPAVYVCERFACREPVTEPEEIEIVV